MSVHESVRKSRKEKERYSDRRNTMYSSEHTEPRNPPFSLPFGGGIDFEVKMSRW